MSGTPLVEFDGVSHRFRGQDRPAVDSVSLRVAEGEIVAVVGESGCGKSTLGRICCGIIEPSDGTVRFRGKAVDTMPRRETREYRRSVQLVHQDPFASLNPGLPLRTTLGYAIAHHKIARRRELDDFLLELLRRVGLNESAEFLNRYPHQLSGGQRQRVAIARALAGEPAIILADEPTGNLDQATGKSILALFEALNERGATIVLITHDTGIARRMPRRIEMLDGQIVTDTAVQPAERS